jgi:hypothetical protein
MTKQTECTNCPLLQTCPYAQIFETPAPAEHRLQKFSQVPNPYLIEPPAWGEKDYQHNDLFRFDMVLIGNAITQLPLIIFAWQRAFERGVGKGDGTAVLVGVEHINQHQQATLIYAPFDGIEQLKPHQSTIDIPEVTSVDSLTVSLQTPLRLQDNGHALPASKLSAQKWLNALVRRSSLLFELHSHNYTPPSVETFRQLSQYASQIQGDASHLSWKDWQRYSNRQHQTMTLGGLVGEWTLKGDLSPFIPYLFLGQWLHVGKNAVFGLGKYTTSLLTQQ